MLFPKEDLIELLWCRAGTTEVFDGIEYTFIEDKLVDTTRWHHRHKMVFQVSGKYYVAEYRRGATEIQDESPFEHDPDMIECKEVHPFQETITVYK